MDDGSFYTHPEALILVLLNQRLQAITVFGYVVVFFFITRTTTPPVKNKLYQFQSKHFDKYRKNRAGKYKPLPTTHKKNRLSSLSYEIFPTHSTRSLLFYVCYKNKTSTPCLYMPSGTWFCNSYEFFEGTGWNMSTPKSTRSEHTIR